MNCKYCGCKLKQDSAFCMECGKPVKPLQESKKVYCQMCGEEMGEDERFCTNCGTAAGAALVMPQQEEAIYQPEATVAAMEKPVYTVSCPNCGAQILPEDTFCSMCGRPVAPAVVAAPQKKKNNKALAAVLIVLLVLVIGVAGFIGWELLQTSQDKDRDKDDEEIVEEETAIRNEVVAKPKEEEEDDVPVDAVPEATYKVHLYLTIVDADGFEEYRDIFMEESGTLVYALDEQVRFKIVGGETVIASVQNVAADEENGDVWRLYHNGEELTGDLARVMVEDEDTIQLIYEVGEQASEYLLPESNSAYLTVADIEHLDREHLCFARNEIYARHGWIFSVPQIAEFFSTKSWYEGTTLPANFNYNVLNEYEQANIKLIVDYEARFGGSYY